MSSRSEPVMTMFATSAAGRLSPSIVMAAGGDVARVAGPPVRSTVHVVAAAVASAAGLSSGGGVAAASGSDAGVGAGAGVEASRDRALTSRPPRRRLGR